MQIKKKHVVAGVIGLLSISAALIYLQYKKLMDYTIGYKAVRIKKFTYRMIDLDVFLNFLNKSKFSFAIESQKYDVYLNNIHVLKVENQSTNTIKANDTSAIGLNVTFNPESVLKKLGTNAVSLITDTSKLMIKIDMKIKIKVLNVPILSLIPISIPYVYEDSLKNMMASPAPAV